MRVDEKQQSAETDAQNQHQQVTFPIRVRNYFDQDPRLIKVFHKDKDKKDKKKDTLFHIVKNQQIQQEKKNVEKYDLLHDDFLVIEMAGEDLDFRECERDVYIELPFLADYQLSWEHNGKQVDRPINSIWRNTRSDSDKQSEKGRTVIKIPGDQRAWKLEIRMPENLEAYHQTENLNTENLQMQNGDPDDVTVSDNGPMV